MEEALEVSVSGCGEERVDDQPLLLEVAIGWRRSPDAAAGPAGELTRGRG